MMLYCDIKLIIGMAQLKESPLTPKIINIKLIIIICVAVLAFAILEVIIEKPFCSIATLRPVTKKSLKIINPTIQNSIIPSNAKEIKAEETNILSAKGSRNLPSGVS